jgi:hypothetical protein
MLPSVSEARTPVWRHLLPWAISAGALAYVFGYAIDWDSILRATEAANLELFVFITVIDKLAFFLAWAFIQAKAVRDFVEPISVRSLIAIKGAAEMLRTGSNLLSDGAFLFGVSKLVTDRLATILAVILIPFGAHFFVLLCQATLVLPFLEGGPLKNADVGAGVAIGWTTVAVSVAAGRLGYWKRFLQRVGLESWVAKAKLRKLAPIIGWFAVFAAFDVLVQGLASRAFGIDIPWDELIARIPLLYVAISLPSFGNFGVREIAWPTLFADYGSPEALTAFALWTNTVFLAMHALVGSLFLGRALSLWRELREARRKGEILPSPMLHDAIDR